jgi:hypothetical protein
MTITSNTHFHTIDAVRTATVDTRGTAVNMARRFTSASALAVRCMR